MSRRGAGRLFLPLLPLLAAALVAAPSRAESGADPPSIRIEARENPVDLDRAASGTVLVHLTGPLPEDLVLRVRVVEGRIEVPPAHRAGAVRERTVGEYFADLRPDATGAAEFAVLRDRPGEVPIRVFLRSASTNRIPRDANLVLRFTRADSLRRTEGSWIGPWRNSFGDRGTSELRVTGTRDGGAVGLWDGVDFENGRWSGDVLTFDQRNVAGGRDYHVRVTFSSDRSSASLVYRVDDRARTPHEYSGTQELRKR